MIGTIQIGAVALVIEQQDDAGIRYRVEAPVLDYFSRRAKPGAVWQLGSGISPVSREEISAQVLSVYGLGYYIIAYRGPEAGFPYVLEAQDDRRVA